MLIISIFTLYKYINSDFRRYTSEGKILRYYIYSILGIGPFQAIVFYRLARFCLLNKVPFIHSILTRLNIMLNGTEISAYAEIGPGLKIAHTVGIVIGRNAKVGKSLTIFHSVTLGAKTPFDGFELMPNICDNVIIYTGAKVLGDVMIPEGCVIGANALVLNSPPSHTKLIGNQYNIMFK